MNGSRCETVYMPLCARVILDILPWKRRRGHRGHRAGRDRRSIAGHTNHCRNTRGIDDTSAILSLARGAHASVRHGTIPFPYLVRNLYSRRLELDDEVSGAFMKKNRRDRRKNNEISRLISGSSSCGTSRTRSVMSLAFENFFDLYARLKIVSSWACTYLSLVA